MVSRVKTCLDGGSRLNTGRVGVASPLGVAPPLRELPTRCTPKLPCPATCRSPQGDCAREDQISDTVEWSVIATCSPSPFVIACRPNSRRDDPGPCRLFLPTAGRVHLHITPRCPSARRGSKDRLTRASLDDLQYDAALLLAGLHQARALAQVPPARTRRSARHSRLVWAITAPVP
jgi:hypothetical protein